MLKRERWSTLLIKYLFCASCCSVAYNSAPSVFSNAATASELSALKFEYKETDGVPIVSWVKSLITLLFVK